MNLLSFKIFVQKNTGKILFFCTLFYIIFIVGLLIIKYSNFDFNALDLGIYNQVFFNSSEGRLFDMSIHPHSYLGDHFELFIIFLLPFYFLFKSPLILLILQTIFIALSAWPLYLLTKEKLNGIWPLVIPLSFLLYPVILNLQFFEFHLLPFAIPLLLFTFYFYYKNNFVAFISFILLSLMVREDVALVVIMFGVLAIIDKKNIKWVLTPIILGVVWFGAAWNLTGYFSNYGSYKFLAIYGWLGGSVGEMIKNIFTNPFIIIKQIISLNNFLLILGLALPVVGISLLRMKYLLPALLIFIQLLMLKISSTVILQTHYASLLIPFLYIAAIFSLSHIFNNQSSSRIKTLILNQKYLFLVILTTAVVYSAVTFTPLLPIINQRIISFEGINNKIKNELVNSINKEDSVISSFEFLPNLSGRTNIYSLHYAFLGKKQFTNNDFIIDEVIDKMVIDFNDFNIYYLQSQNISTYQEQYPTGADRINQLIDKNELKLKYIIDNYALYEKNVAEPINLYSQNSSPSSSANLLLPNKNENISLIGWEKNSNIMDKSYHILPISFYWQVNKKTDQELQLELTIKNSNQENVYQKIYPLGYGLHPVTKWNVPDIIKTNYWFLIPEKYQDDQYKTFIQLISIKGFMGLDGQRTAIMNIKNIERFGPLVQITL